MVVGVLNNDTMKEKIKDIAVMSYILALPILPVLCFILHKQSMQIEKQRIELWHSHNRERIYASRSLFKKDLLSYYERKDSIVIEALKHNKELDTLEYFNIDEEIDNFFQKEDRNHSLIYKK